MRLPDDLGGALGAGGEGFVVRHEPLITRRNGPFVEELVYTFRLAERRISDNDSGMARGTFECPVCGEDVPTKAKSCPHCGACEKSGWNEDARSTDGLDLPDDDFDYEKFAREEFGSPAKLAGKQLFWKITAVVILVLIAVAFVGQFFLR